MGVTDFFRISGDGYILTHQSMSEPNAENFPPHIHDAWELLFLIRGDITYKVEGQSYLLRKGDLVLTRPSVFHHIQPNSSETYERFNVIFDGDFLPNEVLLGIPEGVDVFGFSSNVRVFDILDKIDFYATKLDENILKPLVGCLIRELIYNTVIPNNYVAGQNASNPLINKAVDYIDRNLATISNIDEICDALYITKSHLHHLFGSFMRVTPKQYITSKRLLLAQRMIRSGSKVTEVSGAVGFDDYATFFRNYKKHFGYSPSEENGRVNISQLQDKSSV